MFLKGEIIQKPCKIELWFFDTALPLNALYHCMGFQVMTRTRQRTDRRTDKVATMICFKHLNESAFNKLTNVNMKYTNDFTEV
jgi:hypothetical protein